jgi:hypothetical protein
MAASYDTELWASQTDLGRRLFNRNFRMQGRELPGWKLVKVVPMHEDRSATEVSYLWQDKGEPERHLVRISVTSMLDWRSAQKHLVGMLGHTMRGDLVAGIGQNADVGDVAFTARAAVSDLKGAVQFARGNLAVAVNSVGSSIVDVAGIAARVDHMLTSPPSRASLKGLTRRLLPRTVTTEGRASVSLLASLVKYKRGWLKVLVDDGELRQRGEALVYTSTKAGKKDVQIYLTAEARKPAAPT